MEQTEDGRTAQLMNDSSVERTNRTYDSNKSISLNIEFNGDIKKSEDYQHLICSYCEE